MLVSRESAIQRGSRNPQDIFHIDRDHSNLVKFEPDEIAYFTVRTFVLDILTPGASAVGGDSESQMDRESKSSITTVTLSKRKTQLTQICSFITPTICKWLGKSVY